MPPALYINSLVVSPCETNCYLVGPLECGASPSRTGEVIAIDPGGDADLILRLIESEGLTVTAIVNTHGHGDHIGANADLKARFDCPIMIHVADADFLTDPMLNLSGCFGEETALSPAADRLLQDGDEIEVGPVTFRVIHTPGHTPGGICLYTDGRLFAGDTLFAGSVGRTDFPGGSMDHLITGIREKLLVLPDDTIVYPGHGPTTTIGDEKIVNPYL